MFRHPGLFDSWADVIVDAFLPAVMLGACAAFVASDDHVARWIGGAVAFTVVGWLASRFGPRARDMWREAYRTRQGVGVLFDGVTPYPREFVEDAIERAIVAHVGANGCTRESIDGYGLRFVPSRIEVPGYGVVGGLTDEHWMRVSTVRGDTAKVTSEIITHEAARALLIKAGVPIPAQQAIMEERGTWWVIG